MYVVARRLGALSVAAALTLSLTCCSDMRAGRMPAGGEPNGIEDLQPGQILLRASEAMADLSDVTFEGQGPVDLGGGLELVTMRVLVTRAGTCETEIRSETNGRFTVRLVGRTQYLRGDVRSLVNLADVDGSRAREVAGKWLAQPAPEQYADGCDLAAAVPMPQDSGYCETGSAGEVGGVPTVELRCQPTIDLTVLHISTVGDPLVLRIAGTTMQGTFDLRMTDHGSGVKVTEPPPAQVIGAGEYA